MQEMDDVQMKPVNKIIVDQKGPISTIEEAMEIATNDTVIKLCEGFYSANIYVK